MIIYLTQCLFSVPVLSNKNEREFEFFIYKACYARIVLSLDLSGYYCCAKSSSNFLKHRCVATLIGLTLVLLFFREYWGDVRISVHLRGLRQISKLPMI